MTSFKKILFAGLALASLSAPAAFAEEQPDNDKLLVVNHGRVVYDDGRNDLFCVIRHRVVAYDYWGQPVYRARTRCR